MKIFHSTASPYVRKVMVTAIEKGLDDQIEKVPTAASPLKRAAELGEKNPLAKVPCLLTDDGRAIFDSPVICAYLDSLKAPHLIPTEPAARIDCMNLEALADGILDAGILTRYEDALRPADKHWPEWKEGQLGKVMGAIDALETTYAGQLTGPLTVGQIAVGCALGWLDFRYGDIDWRSTHPKVAAFAAAIAERPSMKATVPFA